MAYAMFYDRFTHSKGLVGQFRYLLQSGEKRLHAYMNMNLQTVVNVSTAPMYNF